MICSGGVNINILTVDALIRVDAAFPKACVIVHAFIGYAQLIIGILNTGVRVYPGVDVLAFKITVCVVVTVDRNFISSDSQILSPGLELAGTAKGIIASDFSTAPFAVPK